MQNKLLRVSKLQVGSALFFHLSEKLIDPVDQQTSVLLNQVQKMPDRDAGPDLPHWTQVFSLCCQYLM